MIAPSRNHAVQPVWSRKRPACMFAPLDESAAFMSPCFSSISFTHISLYSNSPSLFVSSSLFPFFQPSVLLVLPYRSSLRTCGDVLRVYHNSTGMFKSTHILPTDGSNCETLSKRTDHLRLYRKLLSRLPLPLNANRWTSSYAHSPPCLSIRIRDTFTCSGLFWRGRSAFILSNIQ